MSEQKTTKVETLSPVQTSNPSTTTHDSTKSEIDTKQETERKTETESLVEPAPLSAPANAPLSPIRAPKKTMKPELYDPLSPTRSPDEYNWMTLSESISNFRARSDKENYHKEYKEVNRDFRSHGGKEFKKEFRNCEGKEYKKEFWCHGGKGYNKEFKDYGGKGFMKAELRECKEYENECGDYKEFNKACTSFRTYDPLDDVSYFYEPKRTALKSNFASQLEQYFILDTPFTLTKSIEEDYPAPNNQFLVPPKWDLYAELFVEQAAEAHNWTFFERKMIAITDARLLKAQNAIVRVSGPLIRTLGTKVTTDRNCSYQAIWISIGYAFWFLSRVRRQLLLEAVLGTRDRKRIDRYLNDANKMSMFWPDNSDLLGKKFFDHIVQSERRQEEFRDVLMKDVRRCSDQRVRKHDLVRNPSAKSRHQEESSSFNARRRKARSSSYERTLKYMEVRSSGEERGSRHAEVSTLSERRSSRHIDVSSPSDERPLIHTKVRSSSEGPSSRHADVRTSRDERSSRQSEVLTPCEERSLRYAEVCISYEERSSRYAEVFASADERSTKSIEVGSNGEKRTSKHSEVRTHGEDRSSKYAETRSPCEERGSRYAEVKPSSRHGDRRHSDIRIPCNYGDVKNSEVSPPSYKGIPLFSEVISSNSALQEDGECSIPSRKISSEEKEQNRRTRFSRRSSKRAHSISEASSKKEDRISETYSKREDRISETSSKREDRISETSCKREDRISETSSKREDRISETSSKREDKVSSPSSKRVVEYESNEEEDEEEEGEIRDIFTPFSFRKKESSKLSYKSKKENSKSSSERRESCSNSNSERKEYSSKSCSERKEDRFKSFPKSNSERKEDSSKSFPEKKEVSSKSNSDRKESSTKSPSGRKEDSYKSSDSERKEDCTKLSSKRRCEESEDKKESGHPSFKRRRVRSSCEDSSSCNEELLSQKTAELAAQFDKNMKLEVEFSFLKDTNKKLNDVNRELEDNLQSNQEQLERKGCLISDLQRELDQLRSELEQVREERTTFQTLACEKDTRISNLKTDYEAFKLKERGWNMEKKKLTAQVEELQAQVASQSKLLTEREDSLKKLQRDIDLLNSDQTVNEQHRQQLTNLRLEIEQRKDKEKMFELEKLRLDKDKLVQDIETKAKLRHGEMEKTLDQLSDENSKLEANLVALQNKLDSQIKEIEEERETTAMFKAEAERDIKLQKQNTAVELEELKEQAVRRDAAFQERISALQAEIQNRPSGSGVNTGDGSTNTDPAVPTTPDTEQLALQIRDQAREIENLRAVRARSLQISVTQFQKGDTVFFYYDEAKSNYLVANISPNEYQYFLHPDNLGALGLSLDPPGRKPWAIGVIKDKEFCQARKVNNRFKVPEGRKFYRVYAQPRANADPTNAPTNAPTNSTRNPD